MGNAARGYNGEVSRDDGQRARTARFIDGAKAGEAEQRRRTKAQCSRDEERGDAIVRACRGTFQIIAARDDGIDVLSRRIPPASDYPEIFARLNRRWRRSKRS